MLGRKAFAKCAAMVSATIGLTFALPSCGNGPGSDVFATTLKEAVEAFAARDSAEICARLSQGAKEVIGYAAHSEPTRCERDVRRYFRWVRPHRSGGDPILLKTSRNGPNRATGSLELPDRSVVTVRFAREDGDWKLDGIFDATLSQMQVLSTARERGLLPTAEPPTTTRQKTGVVVHDARGDAPKRCPHTTVERFPTVSGGCPVDVSGQKLALSAVGPFGRMAFARCDVAYRLHIDGRGGLWVTNLTIGGAPVCIDAIACRDTADVAIPWRGRLRRGTDGAIALHVDDACLDTCIGRFEGSWAIALIEGVRRWRARADRAMIGTSGWRFDGSLESAGKPISIERRPQRPAGRASRPRPAR